MVIWPNSTGLVPGWSPTNIVQMVLIGCICRSRGQKIGCQPSIIRIYKMQCTCTIHVIVMTHNIHACLTQVFLYYRVAGRAVRGCRGGWHESWRGVGAAAVTWHHFPRPWDWSPLCTDAAAAGQSLLITQLFLSVLTKTCPFQTIFINKDKHCW